MKHVTLTVASRVLGATKAEIRGLCAVIGAQLTTEADEVVIGRETLDSIYRTLYGSRIGHEQAA